MASKQVAFFQPILVARNGTRQELKAGFWREVRERLAPMGPDERTIPYRFSPYYGEPARGKQPARDYIRVGRVRRQADWPETIDRQGHVEPLELVDADIFEGAYLVPFGTGNRVAYMGPLRGSIVSTSAVEWWLSAVLGFDRTDSLLELVPEVDPTLMRKLSEADGLTKLRIKLPRGSVPQTAPEGRGQIEHAIIQAAEAAEDQLNVEVGFSFGHSTPKGGLRQQMQSVAQRFIRQGGATKIEVGLILEDEDGTHIETVDLLKNKVAVTVELPSDDEYRMTSDEILQAIDDAIIEFQQRTN